MGTTIDDIHRDEYLEQQHLEDEKEKTIKEFVGDQRLEYYEQVESLLSNISVSSLSEYYKSTLSTSIEHELWEYCITIIWKTVVLFFYEKLFQINHLNLLHTDFQNSLNSKNRDCLSPLSFNCIKDKILCDKMTHIWRNLDINYQNSCRSLLDERNSLSHVNEYPYSEVKFKAFLEKAAELLSYLQSLHLNHFDKIVEYIKNNSQFPNLSQVEIAYLIKNSAHQIEILTFLLSLISMGEMSEEYIENIKEIAINRFVFSNNFDTAYKNGRQLILPLISQLTETDYKKILIEVFSKQKGNDINQILEAGSIEEIFEQMYLESMNTYPKLAGDWKIFLRKVDKLGLKGKFQSLSLD